jgi:hypothetical protein
MSTRIENALKSLATHVLAMADALPLPMPLTLGFVAEQCLAFGAATKIPTDATPSLRRVHRQLTRALAEWHRAGAEPS